MVSQRGRRTHARNWLIALLVITVSACNTTSYIPTARPPMPTFPAPRDSITYWDMGIRIRLPANWIAFYGAGQLLIASSAAATQRNPPTEPLIALRYATLAELRLDKNATLEQIAAVISGPTENSTRIDGGKTSFAALDTSFVTLQQADNNLIEQALAFRMPDGRIGWLIGLAPAELWANFALVFDQIRGSAALIRPGEYAGQPSTPETAAPAYFSDADLSFMLPAGWVDQPVPGGARLYRRAQDVSYQDGSGLANGPQLVASIFPRTTGQSLAEALTNTLQIKTAAPTFTPAQIGTEKAISALTYETKDAASRQIVTFIAFEQPAKSGVIILRWTRPAALIEVARPMLDGLLASLKIGR